MTFLVAQSITVARNAQPSQWLCQPELAPLFSCDLAPPGVRRAGEFFFDLAPPGGPRSGGSETLLGRLPGDAQGGADGLP